MTKQEFAALAKEKIMILDGATGSNLQKQGMPTGVCPEKWITENPQVLLKLQQEYVAAGADILYAPTFSGNRVKLAEYGLEHEIREINQQLARLSKEAAGTNAYVAADLTMTGEQLYPVGTLKFEELIEIYKEQIIYLAEAGVDLIVVETMMSLQETRAAILAAKETCDLPVMATMTFREDGKTFYGTDAATAVVVLQSLGADAVGINCSAGPDLMLPMIRQMKQYARIPLIAKPNAGLPVLDEAGHSAYNMDAETFVSHMEELIEAGVTIAGGCCGTTPEYIKKLAQAMQGRSGFQASVEQRRVLASERQVLEIGLNGRFKIVGERINPTGKKALQAQLKEGCYDIVKKFAEEQEQCGASILDVNVGMNGIDEKETMLQVITEVTQVTGLPLCLDSSYVEVMEAALRLYPGRALINSISMESSKLARLIPIAKKYGAMFILLPLSDRGLPKSLEEKKEIIHNIMEAALSQGIAKEDIVVDGLVATVGANKQAALETLETIRYCKEELGLATIVGLSNISFGLPGRSYVNTAFLTMAVREGLTMAIANPSQELLVLSAAASDLLLAKEASDIAYIETASRLEQNSPAAGRQEHQPAEQKSPEQLEQDVLKGNKADIIDHVKTALAEGNSPSGILSETLIPAINKVGELFDKQIYFLPQLISSAEAMKTAISYLEPMLEQDSEQEEKAVIVIATVEGDIHDIGKNLVALMLKNYGYQVIDLGKDVSKEKIVEAAIKHNAKIIALSALMTTTMQEMRHVIRYAKEKGAAAKVIIGGAVITQSYADEIGADGYSKDAAGAVKLVQEILKD